MSDTPSYLVVHCPSNSAFKFVPVYIPYLPQSQWIITMCNGTTVYTYTNMWVCLKMSCTPLYPMVLLIIIPFLNGYFIGNINPTFSDKPMSVSFEVTYPQETGRWGSNLAGTGSCATQIFHVQSQQRLHAKYMPFRKTCSMLVLDHQKNNICVGFILAVEVGDLESNQSMYPLCFAYIPWKQHYNIQHK